MIRLYWQVTQPESLVQSHDCLSKACRINYHCLEWELEEASWLGIVGAGSMIQKTGCDYSLDKEMHSILSQRCFIS